VSIDFKELRELLGAIAQTDITEFCLKNENFELTIKKNVGVFSVESTSAATLPADITNNTTLQKSVVIPPANNGNTQAEATSPTSADRKWVAITSPMVGTFYRASAPDEAPFVEVGDRIGKNQTVCIIEAMKLMNEIESDLSGVVMEVLVENGQPVEYGQNLMWVKAE
jgi:acetyl-CoA carboxylase biotin carboxyl carrier protein